MRQALLYGPRDVRVEERDIPEPGPGEVRVRVLLSTIYGTDIKYWDGTHQPARLPSGLGAEMAGRVDALGEGATKFTVGQRVLPEIPHCGVCTYCTSGRLNLCVDLADPVGNRKNQTFQDYAIFKEHWLIPLPDAVKDEDAATIGGLTLHLNMLEKAGLPAGSTALLLGIGSIGSGFVQVARLKGLEVCAVDVRENRLAVARDLGAQHALLWDELPEKLSEIWPDGPDLVVDMAGYPATANAALDYVTVGGTVCLGVTGAYDIPTRKIGHKELRILGARGSHHRHEALRAIQEHGLGLGRTITHRYPLDRIAEAFEMSVNPIAGRVAIDHT